MRATWWNGEPGDPDPFDTKDIEERCPRCGAHVDDVCECLKQLREMDVDPEGEVA